MVTQLVTRKICSNALLSRKTLINNYLLILPQLITTSNIHTNTESDHAQTSLLLLTRLGYKCQVMLDVVNQ